MRASPDVKPSLYQLKGTALIFTEFLFTAIVIVILACKLVLSERLFLFIESLLLIGFQDICS
jgi:hypothetical protein